MTTYDDISMTSRDALCLFCSLQNVWARREWAKRPPQHLEPPTFTSRKGRRLRQPPRGCPGPERSGAQLRQLCTQGAHVFPGWGARQPQPSCWRLRLSHAPCRLGREASLFVRFLSPSPCTVPSDNMNTSSNINMITNARI